jgi:hypothetical protein
MGRIRMAKDLIEIGIKEIMEKACRQHIVIPAFNISLFSYDRSYL